MSNTNHPTGPGADEAHPLGFFIGLLYVLALYTIVSVTLTAVL